MDKGLKVQVERRVNGTQHPDRPGVDGGSVVNAKTC